MIGIVGLGYVGVTSLLCFHKLGAHVIGVDNNDTRIKDLNSGKLPIHDSDLDAYLKDVFKDIEFNTDLSSLKDCSDIFICVPTNSKEGRLNLDSVKSVIRELDKIGEFNFWIRSTVDTPSVFETLNSKTSRIFSFPEFLREGKCWEDFFNPPLLILGGDKCEDTLVYSMLKDNIRKPDICNIPEAITVKIASNAFHALKVAFTNELRNIEWIEKIDLSKVMSIFSTDQKLNVSKAYLKPGLPFGGPCLPKDTLALSSVIRRNDSSKNLFQSVLDSNNYMHLKYAEAISNKFEGKRIGFYGLEFKPGTGDLRNSPILEIIKLVSKKNNVLVFDELLSEDMIRSNNLVCTSSLIDLADQSDVLITYKNGVSFPHLIDWNNISI